MSADRDSVVVLYKGGRLPSWNTLTPEEQAAYQHEHVDRMLSVSRTYGLMNLEGFQLITPQQNWERFWTIEFPCLAGAQAWIDNEIAPPYGRYGYYEYFVALRWRPEYFNTWITKPRTSDPVSDSDPHVVPTLSTDQASVVVLMFGRWLSESVEMSPEVRGDEERVSIMKAVAQEYGLMRYEVFKLIGPQENWHLVWIIEFSDLAGAEAWINADVRPPHGQYATRSYYLARKWAPTYFATWVSPQAG